MIPPEARESKRTVVVKVLHVPSGYVGEARMEVPEGSPLQPIGRQDFIVYGAVVEAEPLGDACDNPWDIDRFHY